MKSDSSLRVLMLSPQCDRQDVGESRTAYDWINRLAYECDLTLLTLSAPGQLPPSEQLPHAHVIEWNEVPRLQKFQRLSSMLKPWYLPYYVRAKQWIKKSSAGGTRFDLVHQLTPLAIRYPSPAVGLGIPFIIGPLAGSLSTPPAFQNECQSAPLYTRLRHIDQFRLRYDPWLRRTYEEAEIVLCSSPYVQEILSQVRIKQCRVVCEVGVEELQPQAPRKKRRRGELRMLHVGRAVRTKGLRDAVRAIAKLPDLPNVTLDAAGGGEELEICREEAKKLGVSDRIRFLGPVPRERVEELYQAADLFLFPSFREPTGIVLLEAMRFGLPCVTTNRGGPGHIVDESCGVQVDAQDPVQFANDLALVIREIALSDSKLVELSEGARKRAEVIGTWRNKIDHMLRIYKSIADRHRSDTRDTRSKIGKIVI